MAYPAPSPDWTYELYALTITKQGLWSGKSSEIAIVYEIFHSKKIFAKSFAIDCSKLN